MDNARPLTAAQARFIDELVADPTRNATAAYERVYAARGAAAQVNASRLLADPRILAEIARRDEATAERNRLTVDRLAQHLAELVEADPRDLIEYRRGACRHCHGHNFRYQRTVGELERDVAEYKKQNKRDARVGLVDLDPMAAFFDYAGGVGFNPNKDPNPECPECFGRGEGYTYAKDLRKVPSAAARLFAGVKETKDGFEIKTRSQDKALELAMRAAGMLKDRGDEDEQGPPPPTSVSYVEQDASDPAQVPEAAA